MHDIISVTGAVATEPRATTTGEGLHITTFRLASSQRRYDRAKQAWVDAETNWYTVAAFRSLAVNAGESIRKGDRVVVRGRLRIRDWTNGERAGTTVEIEAESLGHDLAWGTTVYTRRSAAASAAGSQPDGAERPVEGEPMESFASAPESTGAPEAELAPTPF